MEEEKLLYAIITKRGAEETRNGGESSPLPLSSLALPSITGIDEAPLETIPYRDLAAVVSVIDLNRFAQACPDPCRGEERLRADMVRYQQVNLTLLQHYTVVPLRFGFTARDREHVEDVLGKIYLQLRTLLKRLDGTVELIVQAFWDLPKILQGIAAQDEYLVQAKREATREQRSMTSEQRAIAIGQRLFGAAEARKKELTAVIHAHLSRWAMDSAEGSGRPVFGQTDPEPSRRAEESETTIGVERIFNRSYLVEKEQEPLFDTMLDQLSTRYQPYVTFSYIGPLPAYSFTNIEFNQGNFEVIARARQTLTLPEQASLEDIKAAYRCSALSCHPDRHPEDSQAGERFRAITSAYEVLETYCRSLQNFLGETPPYSFAREQVERTFTVKEQREACYP
jgi:hypothetical protein